jgi:hypothetical protein
MWGDVKEKAEEVAGDVKDKAEDVLDSDQDRESTTKATQTTERR